MDQASWVAPPGAAQPTGIQSTAGAVPVYNEKGERSMKKVKVQRYISGKRPDYAPVSSDDEVTDEDDDFTKPRGQGSSPQHEMTVLEMQDPRLKRLMALDDEGPNKNRMQVDEQDDAIEEDQDRAIHKAEVVEIGEDEGIESDREVPSHRLMSDSSDTESEGDVDENELALRRQRLREKALNRIQQEEELLGKEDEKSSSSEESESDIYSESSDSEEEGPRLKPVFVRKKDRVTIQQKQTQNAKQKQIEIENKKRADERRREMLRLIEHENRQMQSKNPKDVEANSESVSTLEQPLNSVVTDDEVDDAEYESWKLRELKRLKRDKEEREALDKEREEADRLRNLTEEERRIEFRNNPKLITNKVSKGKYKFLQKYYHRGAFFLDKEDEIFRRDNSGATLEDHFDKTILPKVMQVKNFGRSGRTKYTHLVEQDTTSFESPWANDSHSNHKFANINAGGMKQILERPSALKKSQSSSNSAGGGVNQSSSRK